MLDKSLQFLKLLRDLEKVERTIYRPLRAQENDVEHSYQIAMMGWFLNDQMDLGLSKEKLLTYGLVHDLVEAYAGDTPVYTDDPKNSKETKHEREAAALETIRSKFTHFPDLIDIIESYEQKADPESIFIYEIDKLVPILNIYLDEGYGWNKLGLTLDQIKKEKRSKITQVVEIKKLLEELLSQLDEEKDSLFDLD